MHPDTAAAPDRSPTVAMVAGELSDALAARELALPASSALAVRVAAETVAEAAAEAAATTAVAEAAACMSSTRSTSLATVAAEVAAPRSLSQPRETLAVGKVGKTRAVTARSWFLGREYTEGF
jgi:hypothetical protein